MFVWLPHAAFVALGLLCSDPEPTAAGAALPPADPGTTSPSAVETPAEVTGAAATADTSSPGPAPSPEPVDPEPADPAASSPEPEPEPDPSPPGPDGPGDPDDRPAALESATGLDDTAPPRRFMVGIEAVGMQLPPIDTTLVEIDPRTVGDTATLGGAGLFVRYRPTIPVGLDVGVRSGSLRYVDDRHEETSVVSHDVVSADIGAILYLARGEMGHVGIDAGGGGMYNRIGYTLASQDPSHQVFGSGFVRVGFDVELLTRRIAFIFTLRSLGVITPQKGARHSGPLFDRATTEQLRPAVSKFQTHVVGGAGVAYRF